MDNFEKLCAFWVTILIILLIISIVNGVIGITKVSEYNCVTIDGEEIKCVSIYCEKGYIRGKTSDGTFYIIKSYKEIQDKGE